MEARQRRRAVEPRPHRLEIRLSDEEQQRIGEKAAARGMARASFLVAAGLGDLSPGPDRMQMLSELMGIRRSLAGLELMNDLTTVEWAQLVARLDKVLTDAGLT